MVIATVSKLIIDCIAVEHQLNQQFQPNCHGGCLRSVWRKDGWNQKSGRRCMIFWTPIWRWMIQRHPTTDSWTNSWKELSSILKESQKEPDGVKKGIGVCLKYRFDCKLDPLNLILQRSKNKNSKGYQTLEHSKRQTQKRAWRKNPTVSPSWIQMRCTSKNLQHYIQMGVPNDPSWNETNEYGSSYELSHADSLSPSIRKNRPYNSNNNRNRCKKLRSPR